MTDYNDGNWHGWNGGECPVHPQTEVSATHVCGTTLILWPACRVDWEQPLLFRVTKPEPKQPREFWIAFKAGYVIDVVYEKPNDMYGYIHVREVLE
jgi:hypothetical protein